MWLPLSQLHRGRWQWVNDGSNQWKVFRKTPLGTLETEQLAFLDAFYIFHYWLAEWLKCNILYAPLEVQTARPPSAPRERGKKHFWCFGALWYDGVRPLDFPSMKSQAVELWRLAYGICFVFQWKLLTIPFFCFNPFVSNALWRWQPAVLSGAVGVVLAS